MRATRSRSRLWGQPPRSRCPAQRPSAGSASFPPPPLSPVPPWVYWGKGHTAANCAHPSVMASGATDRWPTLGFPSVMRWALGSSPSVARRAIGCLGGATTGRGAPLGVVDCLRAAKPASEARTTTVDTPGLRLVLRQPQRPPRLLSTPRRLLIPGHRRLHAAPAPGREGHHRSLPVPWRHRALCRGVRIHPRSSPHAPTPPKPPIATRNGS